MATKDIKKSLLWVLSNIAANSEEDAEKLVDSVIIMHLILCCNDSAFSMRKEAIWTISNIINSLHNPVIMQQLLDYDIISAFISVFDRDFD